MNQTRKCNSINDPDCRIWPTTVRVTMEFTPVNGQHPGFAVYYLDCAIFTILQLTNTGERGLRVGDLVIDDEFRPSFAVASLSDQLFPFWFPFDVSCGSSLGAVLCAHAPRLADSSCYHKIPNSLVVSTSRGNFTFNAGDLIPATPEKLCVGL